MEKAINRLHRQILSAVNVAGDSHGALVIVGTAQGHQGKVTSFSGGNAEPIVMGLLKEMRRDPAIAQAVRMALVIYDNEQNKIASN